MEYDDRFQQTQRSKYDCLLFDLDDTLYPLNSGLAIGCRNNIEDYMVQKLGIEKSKISDLGNLLYKNYGTTMAGLRAIGYHFDYDDYHSFVHGRLPYEKLKPDPVLRNLLLSLPLRKVIFTNGDKVHAAKVLSKLGLEDCFEGIICFETLNPTNRKNVSSDNEVDSVFDASAQTTTTDSKPFDIVGHFAQPNSGSQQLPKTPILCKPSEDAFEQALRIANIDPQRTVTSWCALTEQDRAVRSSLLNGSPPMIFFDDSVRNIQSGKRVGLHTVLVGTSQRTKGADFALESIHNIREALPELWEVDEKSEIRYSGKIAIETSVTA